MTYNKNNKTVLAIGIVAVSAVALFGAAFFIFRGNEPESVVVEPDVQAVASDEDESRNTDGSASLPCVKETVTVGDIPDGWTVTHIGPLCLSLAHPEGTRIFSTQLGNNYPKTRYGVDSENAGGLGYIILRSRIQEESHGGKIAAYWEGGPEDPRQSAREVGVYGGMRVFEGEIMELDLFTGVEFHKKYIVYPNDDWAYVFGGKFGSRKDAEKDGTVWELMVKSVHSGLIEETHKEN